MSKAFTRNLDRLRQFVVIETPTGNATAIRSLQLDLVETLTSLGATATWEEHATGAHAVCTLPGAGARADLDPLLMLLHADTVWPLGQLEHMPWRVEDGIAHGPGVYDMKGGIVVAEEALRQVAGQPHRPIVVVIVADEEIGSPTARTLVEKLAGTAHAVLGFEPPHPDGALKTARWGSTRLRVNVAGREAHAALDAAAGVSAIDELVDQLLVIRRLTGERADVLCNVGSVNGGTRTNVISGAAQAELGLRFQNESAEEETLEQLRTLKPIRPGADIRVEILSQRPAWGRSAVHDDLMERIAHIARDGGTIIEGRPATGAADTNLTGRLGVPSVDGLGPVGQGAHAQHEQILVSSLRERIDLVARLLTGL